MRMLRTFVDAIGEKNCNVFFPDSHILTDKMLVRPKSCWNLADILWFKKLCHKAKVSTNRTVSDPCLKYILCLFISILLLLIFIRTRFCGFCWVSFVLVVPVERWNTSRLCSAQRKKRTIWSWCLGKCHTSSGHVWIMISHDFCFIIFKQFYMFKISLFFILFKCRFINSIWSRLLDPLVVVKICLRRYLSLKRPFVCFFAQIEWGLLCFSFVWFALDLRNYGHLSSSLPEFLLLLNASHIFTQGWCFFFILTFIFPLNLENITAFF